MDAERDPPRIDGDRLWDSIMAMAEVGATEAGGVRRLALSDADRRGRDLFVGWCREAGCSVAVDRVGNLFARRPGGDPERPPVVIGSHLDSQPTGGRFDGAYGVLCGLEIVRVLNELGVDTDAPLEVAVWTSEEGARFAPAMLGAGVFGGAFELDYALQRRDREGRTVAEELERIGYSGDRPVGGRPLGAHLEAHIEQGPVLESEEVPIGLVTGVQGIRWYDLELLGNECHAGTTPMEMRRDPLRAGVRLLDGVFRLADRHPGGRVTVGELEVRPGSRNTVPGRIELTVDLRHPDAAVLEAMDADLRAAVDGVDAGVEAALEEVWVSEPVSFDETCLAALRRAAEEHGYAHREIVSGAGHDSVYVARVAPTAMVFVPCEDGISHNEAESAEPEDLEAGCNVLLGAVLELADAETTAA